MNKQRKHIINLSSVGVLLLAAGSAQAFMCPKNELKARFDEVARTIQLAYEDGTGGGRYGQRASNLASNALRKLPQYRDFLRETNENRKASEIAGLKQHLEEVSAGITVFERCFDQGGTNCGIDPENQKTVDEVLAVQKVAKMCQSAIKDFGFKCAGKASYYTLNSKNGGTKLDQQFRAEAGDLPYDKLCTFLKNETAYYKDSSESGIDSWRRENPSMLADNQKYVADLETHFTQQVQKQAAQSDEEKRLIARHKLLKSGKAKVSSFVDAVLYYEAHGFFSSIVRSPLLSADKKYYRGQIKVDKLERKGWLRVKVPLTERELYERHFTGQDPDQRYAYMKVTDSQVKGLATNQLLDVVGQYVGNQEYRTVIGTEKVAPVLKVKFLAPLDDPTGVKHLMSDI